VLAKSVGQVRLVAEAAVEGNLTQRHLASGQQLRSQLNPATQDVSVRAQAESTLEGARKMRRGAVHQRAQMRDLDGFGDVPVNVFLDPTHLPGQH
jgi:hypothetical protein